MLRIAAACGAWLLHVAFGVPHQAARSAPAGSRHKLQDLAVELVGRRRVLELEEVHAAVLLPLHAAHLREGQAMRVSSGSQA